MVTLTLTTREKGKLLEAALLRQRRLIRFVMVRALARNTYEEIARSALVTRSKSTEAWHGDPDEWEGTNIAFMSCGHIWNCGDSREVPKADLRPDGITWCCYCDAHVASEWTAGNLDDR
jgi:hypothetical protein